MAPTVVNIFEMSFACCGQNKANYHNQSWTEVKRHISITYTSA
jgi:uncharacterized Zn-finger protein